MKNIYTWDIAGGEFITGEAVEEAIVASFQMIPKRMELRATNPSIGYVPFLYRDTFEMFQRLYPIECIDLKDGTFSVFRMRFIIAERPKLNNKGE